MLAHLQLEDYWIDELVLRDVGTASAESPETEAAPLPRVEFAVFPGDDEEDDDASYYVVSLKVVAGRAKVLKGLPYEFRIQVFGIFTVAPELDEDERYRLIHLNGPAMLYGIARTMIGSVTANGRKGKYILPSINVLEILRRQKRRTRDSEHRHVVSG